MPHIRRLQTVVSAIAVCIITLVFCSVYAAADSHAMYTYEIKNGTVEITNCEQSVSGKLEIPSHIRGYPVTSIGSGAFSGCTHLSEVIIPDTVRAIDPSAFFGCTSLNSVCIPDSVEEIGGSAFGGCSSIAAIELPFIGRTATDKVNSNIGYIFDGSNNYGMPKTLREVSVSSAQKISAEAFEGCAYIEKIRIGASVSAIEQGAFADCTSLVCLEVDEKNTTYHSDGNCIIHTSTKRLIAGCAGSRIPSDGSVVKIGAYAFSGITGLKSITVPDSVTEIECGAIFGCTSLESLSIPFVGQRRAGGAANFGYIFGAKGAGSHNAVTIPQSLREIVITGDCSIGTKAFSSCKNIVSFRAEGNINAIAEFAFLDCVKLREVRFEGKLGSIAQSAFLNCTSLEKVQLPDSVERIGNSAFENCGRVKILCVADSVAYEYAKKHRIPYELIDAQSAPPVDTDTSAGSPDKEHDTVTDSGAHENTEASATEVTSGHADDATGQETQYYLYIFMAVGTLAAMAAILIVLIVVKRKK